MIVIEWKQLIVFCITASLIRTFIFGISEYPLLFRSFIITLISLLITSGIGYFGYKYYIRKTSK